MNFGEILMSVVVGLITGAFSSLCVNEYWTRKIDEKERKRKYYEDFEKDEIDIMRFLEEMRRLLKLAMITGDCSELYVGIESLPGTPSFTNMNEKGQELMLTLTRLLNEIEKECDEKKLKKIDNAKCEEYIRRTNALVFEFVFNKRKLQKTWEEHEEE